MGVKVTSKLLATAASNGIDYDTLRVRLRRGWEAEHASTLPKQNERVFTDEELAIARANGINKDTLYYRVKTSGLSIEEAITKPLKSQRNFRDVALRNGISRNVFHARLKRGWTPQEASSQPIDERRRNFRKRIHHRTVEAMESLGLTRGQMRRAVDKGIGVSHLKIRIQDCGWDIEKAVTEPIHIGRRKGVTKKDTKISRDIQEIAELNGIGYKTLWHRINVLGWSAVRACTEKPKKGRRKLC